MKSLDFGFIFQKTMIYAMPQKMLKSANFQSFIRVLIMTFWHFIKNFFHHEDTKSKSKLISWDAWKLKS
jgi:hypothetical protein